MNRPNEEQVQIAGAILTHHNNTYGMSGAEGSLRRAVFSIFAAMGGIGKVADEYSQVIANSDLKLQMADKETPAPAVKAAPDWFTITSDQETGVVIFEVTGENEYGFEQGMALDNGIPFDADDDFDDASEDGEDEDEYKGEVTGDKRWPITAEQLNAMKMPELKKIASDESADISGKNSKVDVRAAILDNRSEIDAAIKADQTSGD